MFSWLAKIANQRPWIVVVLAIIFFSVAGTFGGPVAGLLRGGGFEDPGSQSAMASNRLTKATGTNPDSNLLALVRTGQSVQSATTRSEVQRVAGIAAKDAAVARVTTWYQTQNSAMVSTDGKQTVLLINFKNLSDDDIQKAAKRLNTALSSDPHVLVGGSALAGQQIGGLVASDLGRAELFALPILFILLLLVFRGLIGALLPLLLGGITIMGTFLAIRIVDGVVPLSVFVTNLVFGLGLGLAIDYSLLLLSRYREELARVGPTPQAIQRTLATAGRTVLFSSLTVAAALASLLIFPQRFLYSFGIGGILVALIASGSALLILPSILRLLGPRVNALSLQRGRSLEGGEGQGRWYRLAHFVMRHAAVVAALVALALIVVGLPFWRIKLTSPDATILPTSVSARQVNDVLQTQFPPNRLQTNYVVIHSASGRPSLQSVQSFAAQIQKVPNVSTVVPPQPAGTSAWVMNIIAKTGLQTTASQDMVKALRSLKAPFSVEVGGPTAQLVDYRSKLGSLLPLCLLIILVVSFIVLFLVTGSVILPVKTYVMNLLTISATFGILVFIFQDGRLQGLLGYTSQHALDTSQPIVLFAVAFGLSTDYGVFLLSRIKESYDSGIGNTEAVANGLDRTGRIVTAAALLIAVAIGAFVTGQIVFMKELGLGAALAVLIDATIVRAFLVPSLMKLLGDWNWWAPAPLRRLHERIGWSESLPDVEPADKVAPADVNATMRITR